MKGNGVAHRATSDNHGARRWLMVSLTLVVAVFAVFAGTASSATPRWSDGGSPKWKSVLKKARAEGKLVLNGPPELPSTSFAKDFQKDTGIKLVLAAGESGVRGAAMRAQAKANKLSYDLAVGGAGELADMLPQGLLRPVAPQLMLADSTNLLKWKNHAIKYVDSQNKYLLQTTNSRWPVVYVNSSKVDPNSIASWKDLLNPKYKGKIAAYDPRAFAQGLLAAIVFNESFGTSYVRTLYGTQNITYSQDRTQLANWVARGTYDIVIAATPGDIAPFVKQGLPVKPVFPKDGPQFLTGSSSALKQPQNENKTPGPHPNAATVFINWYASKNGQISFTKAMHDISRRLDVPVPKDVPSYLVPAKKLTAIDTFSAPIYGTPLSNTRKVIGQVVR